MTNRIVLAVTLILALQASCLWKTTSELSPTIDEYPHLVAGIEYWRTGRAELYNVNPPIVRLWCSWPAVVAGIEPPRLSLEQANGGTARNEFLLGTLFAKKYASEAFTQLVLARRMCILLILCGTVGVFALGCLLTGNYQVALMAMSIYGLNPIVLGYGALLGCDVVAGSAGVWAIVAFVLAIRTGRWTHVCFAGITFGIAILTKLTWLVAIPLWPLGWLWLTSKNPAFKNETFQSLGRQFYTHTIGQCGLAMFIAWLIVCAGYRGERIGQPLGDFEFVSRLLSGHALDSSNVFSNSWLAQAPIFAPATLVEGIDQQWQDFDEPRDCFLAGRWKKGGWYHYYIVALLAKLPLGWTLLLLLSLPSWKTNSTLCASCLILPMVLLAVVSLKTNMNEHTRYVWILLPNLAILAARGFSIWNIPMKFVALLCTCWIAFIGISSVPFGASYVNELFGETVNGRRMLAGSNVDWGQGWIAARRWIDDSRVPVAIITPRWDTLSALETIGIKTLKTSDVRLAELARQLPKVRVLISTDSLMSMQRDQTADWLVRDPLSTIGCCVHVYELTWTELSQVDGFWCLPPG